MAKRASKSTSEITNLSMVFHSTQNAFIGCNRIYKGFVAGVACVAADTKIDGVPIGDWNRPGIVKTLFGDSTASSATSRGRAELYRVRTATGREVVATLDHRFLTLSGWVRLRNLHVGALVAACETEYDRSATGTRLSSQGRCFSDSRRDDGLPYPVEVAALCKWRQLHTTVYESSALDYTSLRLRSMNRSSHHAHATPSFLESEYRALLDACESPRSPRQKQRQAQQWILQQDTCGRFPRVAAQSGGLCFLDQHGYRTYKECDLSRSERLRSEQPMCGRYVTHPTSQPQQPSRVAAFSPYLDAEHEHAPCAPSQSLSPFPYRASSGLLSEWDSIADIQFVRNGEFYDLHVPGINHYAANGFINHNSGKSWVGAYDLLVHAEPGSLVAVCAPTFRQLSDATMRSFVELSKMMGLWDDSQYRKTDNVAILKNGVEVLFRSADAPEANRGPSLRRVWLDEAGLMKEEMFNVMIGRLRQGGKQGTLTATFTPQGKEHWTYRLFSDESNPNVQMFHCSTKDNPFISAEIYENLLLQYGKGEGGMLRAAQELEGKFVCVQGAEWASSWFGPEVWFDAWPHDAESLRVVMLDSSKGIGGKTGDYSCFAKVMYSHGKLYVDFDMDNSRNAAGMAERAIEIQKDFRPDYFAVESEFGGNVMVDDLLNRAEDAKILMPLVLVPTGGVQKDVRIRRLTPYLAQGMVRFKNSEGTRIAVTQMESFPHCLHDDGPDAFASAITVLNEVLAA